MRTRVNRKMDHRPSEQISTAHRYTSANRTQNDVTKARSVYAKRTEGQETETVPANKRHSPSLVPSSRFTCTAKRNCLESQKKEVFWGLETVPRQSIFVNCRCLSVMIQYNKKPQWFPEISLLLSWREILVPHQPTTTNKHTHTLLSSDCIAVLDNVSGDSC